MYNRYIPQADGTYRRNRVADPPQPRPTQRPQPQRPQPAPPPPPPPCQESQRFDPPCPQPKQERQTRQHQPQQVGNFLKNLLPGNFDTADLIIILLLLLLAGDCEEDRNTAMLTLVLYLFM